MSEAPKIDTAQIAIELGSSPHPYIHGLVIGTGETKAVLDNLFSRPDLLERAGYYRNEMFQEAKSQGWDVCKETYDAKLADLQAKLMQAESDLFDGRQLIIELQASLEGQGEGK